MKRGALSVIAIAVVGASVLNWFFVLPRLDGWLEPDKSKIARSAFVAFLRDRYDGSEQQLIVYLSADSISFEELLSLFPRKYPGIEFRPRSAFRNPSSKNADDWYKDQATGKRIQFLSLSIGSVSLTSATVSVMWAASSTGVEGWTYWLFRRPGGWSVFKTRSQAIA
jgi:hypothetical protein